MEAKRLALWDAWSEPPVEGASEGGWMAGGGGGGGPPPAGAEGATEHSGPYGGRGERER